MVERDSTKYRVVLVGARGVGKSALTERFVCGTFGKSEDSTTVEDMYMRILDVDDMQYYLDLFDPSGTGTEDYDREANIFMRDGQGFVLLYSTADEQSFSTIQEMREQVYRIRESTDKVPMVLVGTKCDLDGKHAVETKRRQSLADSGNALSLKNQEKLM